MCFDGVATFSGKKEGVQTRMKKNSPHAIFVNCHLLQLACVRAANHKGIKHGLHNFDHPVEAFFITLQKDPRTLIQSVLNIPTEDSQAIRHPLVGS